MGLFIRMVLYAAFAGMAGAGIGSLDGDGTYSVNVDDLAIIVTGIIGYALTFVASRWAKARGGST